MESRRDGIFIVPQPFFSNLAPSALHGFAPTARFKIKSHSINISSLRDCYFAPALESIANLKSKI